MSPLVIAAAIAIILFCGVGIAAMMGWLPTSMGQSSISSGQTASSQSSAPLNAAPLSSGPQYAQNAPAGDASQYAQTPPAAVPVPVPPACVDCGVVESVREVSVHHRPSGLGLIGGALVGGVLGNAIGGGRGRDLTTVGGAVGGAYVGNQIEKNHSSGAGFAVTVRMDDGRKHTLHYGSLPQWREGDRVHYDHGHLEATG